MWERNQALKLVGTWELKADPDRFKGLARRVVAAPESQEQLDTGGGIGWRGENGAVHQHRYIPAEEKDGPWDEVVRLAKDEKAVAHPDDAEEQVRKLIERLRHPDEPATRPAGAGGGGASGRAVTDHFKCRHQRSLQMPPLGRVVYLTLRFLFKRVPGYRAWRPPVLALVVIGT